MFRSVISVLVLAGAFIGCGEAVAPQVCDGPCVTDVTQPDAAIAPDAPATMPMCPASFPNVGDRCTRGASEYYYCLYFGTNTCICRCIAEGCFWINCDSA
jgi:hypothetical protein